MNYGEILKKSWQIIWKFKILWLFGLLASCGQGSGGGGGGGGNGFNWRQEFPGNGNSNGFNNQNLFPWANEFGRQIERALNDGSMWIYLSGIILGLICLIFVLWFVFTAIGTMGRIGLIKGAWLADEGAEKLSFGQLWNAAKPYFWRIFLFMIVLAFLNLILGLIIILPIILFTVMTLGCGLLCLIPFMIVVGWFIKVIIEQTIVAIVVENLGVMEALERAWKVISGNLVHYVVMSLVLFIGSAIIGIIIALPFLAIVVPLVAGAIADTQTAVITGLVVAGAFFIIYLPILILLSSMLQAYLGTAWTLVYRRAAKNVELISPIPAVESPSATPDPSQTETVEAKSEPQSDKPETPENDIPDAF